MSDILETKRIQSEISRRRTFAIISHPDAGKTTLTEKLLLFGGAIKMAGAVKSRKTAKHATSDWMAIEQERGISVTSSVMRFSYRGSEINLLDTPGHKDFSEDTYRVLSAVDSVIMVIDHVKGVETQTKRLMEICRMRNTPILTFINKLDREGMPPFSVLSEIEDLLQIECTPMTWPIGMGKGFRGTYNIYRKELCLFSPGKICSEEDVLTTFGLSDPAVGSLLGSQAEGLREDVALLEGAASPFILSDYLKGSQTPVFFGSALNNFGVKELLDALVDIAPAPLVRPTTTRSVSPDELTFSGFIFKIQANMDPAHRDRLAFLRVCSGQFTRGMKVRHHRQQKNITIANPILFMAQDRTLVEEAWPGDIIGIHNHGTIKIGDTFTEGELLKFTGIPSFAPELFRRVRLKEPFKAKQMQKGLYQLAEEGAVQLFRPVQGSEYILGAVGELQFDVTIERLAREYNVEIFCDHVDYVSARWLHFENERTKKEFENDNSRYLFMDTENKLAYLASSDWNLKCVLEKWKNVRFMTEREYE